MLGRYRVYLALATAVAVGCSSSEGPKTSSGKGGAGGEGGSTSSSSAATSSSGGGSGGSGGTPACPSGEGIALAASELSFGEGNSGEWKAVGKNIDGLVSTASSKD